MNKASSTCAVWSPTLRSKAEKVMHRVGDSSLGMYTSVSVQMLGFFLFLHHGLISAKTPSPQFVQEWVQVTSSNHYLSQKGMCHNNLNVWQVGNALGIFPDSHSEEEGGLFSGCDRHRGSPLNGMAALSCLAQRLSIVKEEDTTMKDSIWFPSLKVHSKYKYIFLFLLFS